MTWGRKGLDVAQLHGTLTELMPYEVFHQRRRAEYVNGSAVKLLGGRGTGGLYVVEFPHATKIGRTLGLRGRLQSHARAGGLRMAAVVVQPRHQSELARLEDELLVAASAIAEPIGKTEMFTGLPFERAVDLLQRCTHDVALCVKHLDAGEILR